MEKEREKGIGKVERKGRERTGRKRLEINYCVFK